MTKAFYIPPSRAPEERAYLVGVTLPRIKREETIEHIHELELLARTASADVIGHTIQNRTRIDGSTYIGAGKINDLAKAVYDQKINLVIFDDDLSPAQARNIEKRLGINIIDRTELILDIFARRARTRQAKIQVEIAQLIYALPRLRRLWDHLSRQAGGIGTRGPGETQLEVDRRKVRERIAHLKRELGKISRGVSERRKKRSALFNVTAVGYTNAGKSTLLNRVAGSRVVQSNRLFSTLDSTTRKIEGTDGKHFTLTDTIGFIRKLPPHLVVSFRATLLDVREADLLLHVVDAATPGYEERITAVNTVLGSVFKGAARGDDGEDRGRTILVLNKIDLVEEPEERAALAQKHEGAVLISAADGYGIDELMSGIQSHLERDLVSAQVIVSPEDGKAISIIEEKSKVLGRRLDDGRMVFDVRVRKRHVSSLEEIADVRLRPLDSV